MNRISVNPLKLLAAILCLAMATAMAAPARKSGQGAKSVATAKSAKAAKSKPVAAARGAKVRQVAPARKARGGLKAKLSRAAPPPRPSLGQQIGLHRTDDPLDLKSSVALVVDQETDEVLFSKNPGAVLPIASITKLMTAVVVADAGLPLDEVLSVSKLEVADAHKSGRARLTPGTQLTRGELLHLALMASENRAAQTLGNQFPGGMSAFVRAMNRKAAELGMRDTRYVEPTGLSSQNRSSAQDLSLLVRAAMSYPLIRELSTAAEAQVAVGEKQVQFRNTNGLVRNPAWEIGLQKTGYISEAGRCVVMQAQLAGRKLIMVLLDSAGRYSRIGDAERIRHWLTASGALPDLPLAVR